MRRVFMGLSVAALLAFASSPAQAATLGFPFPSGDGSAVCSYTSDGCFSLPTDFNVFVEDTGANEGVNREFELTYVGGGSAVYQLTINPAGSFTGTFTFGEVDLTAPAGDLVLLPATTVALGAGPLILNFANNVLYGITVVGTFAGRGGNYDISLSAVPIPPALLLFGSALVGLGYLARRRRQSTGPGFAAG